MILFLPFRIWPSDREIEEMKVLNRGIEICVYIIKGGGVWIASLLLA